MKKGAKNERTQNHGAPPLLWPPRRICGESHPERHRGLHRRHSRKDGPRDQAKISDKFTSEKLYSDDGVEGMLQAYEGTDVELEVNTLAAADRAAFFGQAYLNGFLLKSAEDEAPEVALGYRVRRLNGKFDFVWMYCGRFAQGNEENYETEAASKTAQTNTVKGEFYQREKMDKVDGKDVHLYEVRVDESNLATEDTGAAAAIKAWFGKVQEYAATVDG